MQITDRKAESELAAEYNAQLSSELAGRRARSILFVAACLIAAGVCFFASAPLLGISAAVAAVVFAVQYSDIMGELRDLQANGA
jgi:hypothetical protein